MKSLTTALLLLLLQGLACQAWAADATPHGRAVTLMRHLKDDSVSTSGESQDYTDLDGYPETDGVRTVCVTNTGTSRTLLFQLVPLRTAVNPSPDPLVAPVSGTWSEVDEIAPQETICYEGAFSGHYWQSVTSATSAKVRVLF